MTNIKRQKYFLGDTVTIDGNQYTISMAEYTYSSGVVIWYRLLGIVSMLKYEDELDALLGIDTNERALLDGMK